MQMKVNFSHFDEPIVVAGLTVLAISDVTIFANFIRGVYTFDGTGQLKIFDSQDFKSIKPVEMEVITDILGFEINSASVLKLIYQDLEIQLSEKPEIKTAVENLFNQVTDLINHELLEFELDLISDEITLLEIFKALGVKVETASDSIFEKIFEVLQVFKYLTKKKLLIFVNLTSYLTSDEILKLEEYCSLQRIDVLLVERYPLANFKNQYYLDEDFIMFH